MSNADDDENKPMPDVIESPAPVTAPAPTAPSLPHVTPSAAPSMDDLAHIVPRAPRLPTIEERRERETASPAPGALMSFPEERESLVDAFRNMLKDHEKTERDVAEQIAEGIAAKLQGTNTTAAAERAALAGQVSTLTDRFDQMSNNVQELFNGEFRTSLLNDFRVAAKELADPFLAKIQELLNVLAEVQEGLQIHELRWKRLDKLKLEELREQHDKLQVVVKEVQLELKRIQKQIDSLTPKPVPQ